MKISRKTGLVVLFLLMICVPYIIAAIAAGPDDLFGGFLLNPADGNSYLAKMYAGWAGSWRFQLPFTAEPGSGAYLFMFYLLLGHLARWAGLPLLLVFHLARVVSAIFLASALWRFLGFIFPAPGSQERGFALALFGAGLGWLALIFGGFTSDLWVAEAYPFLSAFENPHFPLALGLMLWLLAIEDRRFSWKAVLRDIALSFLLGMLLPFGVVIVGMTLGAKLLWDWFERRQFVFWPLLWVGLGGGPVLLYQFWVVQTDPVLANWNAQNLTPSPPVWDLLVSFSPVLLLAVWGGWVVLRRKLRPARIVLVWALLGLVLLYIPFSLQRRFMLGLFIPLAALAIAAIEDCRQRFPGRLNWAPGVVLGLSLPTILMILLLAGFGIATRAPELYLQQSTIQALAWVREKTPARALILAQPQIGLLIPGWTGRRVVYGHPFETANAAIEKKNVEDFFGGAMDQEEMRLFLESRKVNFILEGSNDPGKILQDIPVNDPVVYRNQDFTIYQVQALP